MCTCGKFFCEKYTTCGHPGFRNVTHCIFDMDGTLINSEVMYHEIVAELCQNYGKEYPLRLRKLLYGCTDREICETLIKELEIKVSVQQLEKEMSDLVNAKLPDCPLQIGADRLVKHLYDNKVPIAVATNSTARDVKTHVNCKAEFFGRFHHLVTASDVDPDRGKPHPDIYLKAASKFPDKPKPGKCLVFEDTGTGLEAAKAAGMQIVFTPYIPSQRKFSKKATLVLHNLLEFKPELFGLPRFTDNLTETATTSHRNSHTHKNSHSQQGKVDKSRT